MVKNLYRFNTKLVIGPWTIPKGSEGKILVFYKMSHKKIHFEIMKFGFEVEGPKIIGPYEGPKIIGTKI